ncbi:hypothetical protein K8R47_00495 [archaeon]|nr:hypothetical protein [archaeon]
MNFNKICKDIKNLKIQGASRVARVGLKAYSLKPNNNSIKILRKLRPTEPMLFNILEYAKKFGVKEAKKLIEGNRKEIREVGGKFIKKYSKVFTHCHSGTVVAVLKKNKKLIVYSTETRPLFQGRKTARELSKVGIRVTEIVDSAALNYIKKADILIIGADAVLKNGDVINKIGSGMYAELAYKYRKQLYVATNSLKLSLDDVKIEERKFMEVWKDKPKNVYIDNLAFGVVKSKYIKGIISDLGILKPKDFVKKAKKKYSWLK